MRKGVRNVGQNLRRNLGRVPDKPLLRHCNVLALAARPIC
jgi:hypothetical protein